MNWLRALILLCIAPGAFGATEPVSLDELLSVPHVRQGNGVLTGGQGQVAWVEIRNGSSNIFVAQPPRFTTKRVTAYEEDDGLSVALIGFSVDGAHLYFIRADSGNNPANAPDLPEAQLLELSLGSGSVRRLDGGSGAPLGSPVIAPDGARLLATKGGDVWAYPLRRSGAPERLFSARGATRALSFSPDGRRLAFISDRSGYGRGKYSFVGVFDFSERSLRYMAPGVGSDRFVTWSPDSTRVAFIRVGIEPRSWRFTDFRSGAPFSIVVADAASGDGGAVWSSTAGYGGQHWPVAGTNLAWLADDTLVFAYEKTGWNLLYGIPARGGPERLLTPGRFEIDTVGVSPDRRQILFSANSEQDLSRTDLYRLSSSAERVPKRVAEHVASEMRNDAQFAADSATIVYRLGSVAAPQRLMIRTPDGRTTQLSTGPKPGEGIARQTVTPEAVEFESLDGLRIPAILYRPANVRGQGNHPAIVFAHGGSRAQVYPMWYSQFAIEPVLMRYLVSRGYYALTVNYRSGTGYGLDFREPESYGGRGAGDVQDFIAAARFLTETVSEIDPRRLAIAGHSYGGHIVSNVLARSDVYAAGIDSAGVGDWVTEMEMDRRGALPMNIPQRLRVEQLAYDSSAISQVDRWGDAAILFLHGDHDESAAMQPMLELYLALQRRGKKVDALVFPGEGHAIRLRRNQAAYVRKVERFLDRHLFPEREQER